MLEFFISTEGNDRWSGRWPEPNSSRKDGPFLTLERAREAIRMYRYRYGQLPEGGAVVWIRGGEYRRKCAFDLTSKDSGTRETPIVYQAYPGETVRLIGGKEISGFRPLTDKNVLSRLNPDCHGKIMRVDLVSQGITDFGKMTAKGYDRDMRSGPLEVFFNDTPLEMAHWPNEGWANVTSAPDGHDGGKFGYQDERPTQWNAGEEIWVHGFWTWDWADSFERVRVIDSEKKEITTDPPHGIGGYSENRPWRAVNILDELDSPGEYYVDRKRGLLYLYPPSAIENARVFVSTLDEPMLSLDYVSHTFFRGITLECARGFGIRMSGGFGNTVRECTIRNIGTAGILIDAGRNHLIDQCEIYQTGEGGIVLSGGIRESLAPGFNSVTNCEIHDCNRWVKGSRPGIAVYGVGNKIANNHIYNMSHTAITVWGNEHIVEFNHIENACLETNDAGAIYTGRDVTQRGTVIRFNLIENLGENEYVFGVYLDDLASGQTVFSNIFRNAGQAVFIGGGRDNLIENNLFIKCKAALRMDARGTTWAAHWFDGRDSTLTDSLASVNYMKPPYSEKYPALARMMMDEPQLPKYNRVCRNVNIDSQWLLLDDVDESLMESDDNIIALDPTIAEMILQPGDELPEALEAIGWNVIPFELIGPNKRAQSDRWLPVEKPTYEVRRGNYNRGPRPRYRPR